MKSPPTLFDPKSVSSFSFADITEFSAHGIVSRALLTEPNLRMTLFGFAPGQELSEHTSTWRAVIQILSGTSKWTIDGQTRELGAGEVLHLPPGVPHAVQAVERFSMLLVLTRDKTPTDSTPRSVQN